MSEVRQYLNASDSYFKRKRSGAAVSMDFSFPAISTACPICGGACGAIYRGYYRRYVICPQVLFVGFLAIRTGFCKAKRRRFALFPEFLIPFRSFSRSAFLWLWQAWRHRPSQLGEAVDRWFDCLEQEISLSISTLDSQLRFILFQFRAQALVIPRPGVVAVSPSGAWDALREIAPGSIESIVLDRAFGTYANRRIDPPP